MKESRRWSRVREYSGLKYFEAGISFIVVFCVFLPLLSIRKKKAKPVNNTGKKSILLYGAYGNGSVGDDAILQSILENLDEEIYDITISSYNPMLTGKMTSHKLIWQGRTLDGLFYMYKTLKTTDILIFGGGGVLETHNNSFTTTIGMMYKFSKVYLAKLLNVKVYCFAVGSNTKPYSRLVCRLVNVLLKNVDGISTRDQKSYNFLKEINPNIRVKSLADPALLLKSEISEVRDDGVLKIGINVMPYYKLLNGNKSKLAFIRSEIGKFIDMLITKYKAEVYFTPMVQGDDTREQEAIADYITHEENIVFLQPNYSPNELMNILAGFDIFVGTRLHPNILAYNVNTLILGIAYHEKIFSFFDHIQTPEFVQSIQNISSDKLLEDTAFLLKHKKKIKRKMKSRQGELKALAQENFKDLLEISATG